MRPIKFRAWDKESKLMLNITSIGFDYAGEVKQVTVIDNDTNIWTYDPDNMESEGWDLDRIILMQSIGLYDKEGEEIYEGDIIRTKWIESIGNGYEFKDYPHDNLSVVKFIDGKFTVTIPSAGMRGDVEVVGNTFEHPDLIPDKQNDGRL